MRATGTVVLLLLGSFLTVALVFGTTFPGLTVLIVPTFLLSVVLAEEFRRVSAEWPAAVAILAAASASLAIVSILTGFLNGFSDEPYTTPAYAALGWGLYSHPIHISYVQYGELHFESSYDVYLPLLTFVQLPGVSYRWVSLLAWAAMLYLLRGDRRALAGVAMPWFALLAANGQNDYVPLFALTLSLTVSWRDAPAARWLAEAFALALKQIANVVLVAYHIARREYARAAAAVAITLAILAPFLYLDPTGVWCHAILGDPGSGCVGHPWTFFVFKRNYWLYPTWVVVVFYDPLRRWILARWPPGRTRTARDAARASSSRPPVPRT